MRSRLLLTAMLVVAAGCGTKTDQGPPPAEPAPPPAVADPAPAPAAPVVTPVIQAIVDAPDRSPDDRALDAGRHPGELLAFMGVAPKMRVAELIVGGGYTAELLARAVGPEGKVYAQNNERVNGFAGDRWSARLATPALANVVRVDRELEDPLPPEARNLDIVVMHLFYHDTYWMKVDRAKMNRAILAALKPGGLYVVVDHSARPGAATTEVETLHRIEEGEVERDVLAAGFVLDRKGDFLRNPADTRDWNASPRAAGEKRGTSDRFALVFRKP